MLMFRTVAGALRLARGNFPPRSNDKDSSAVFELSSLVLFPPYIALSSIIQEKSTPETGCD